MSARRLFLEAPPEEGEVRLAPGEAHHGRNVLRLREGDRVAGLDGAGAEWPLAVAAVERGGLRLERAGEPRRAPPLRPEVVLLVALPRAGRAEDMLDRLTQLGVARVEPTWFERTQGRERTLGEQRRGRLERAAREACKQSGRLWLPAIGAPASLAERLEEDGGGALLDPEGEVELAAWLGRGARETVRLLVGPEGGPTDEEVARATAAGFTRARLRGAVLRIETAAELACGLAVQVG